MKKRRIRHCFAPNDFANAIEYGRVNIVFNEKLKTGLRGKIFLAEKTDAVLIYIGLIYIGRSCGFFGWEPLQLIAPAYFRKLKMTVPGNAVSTAPIVDCCGVVARQWRNLHLLLVIWAYGEKHREAIRGHMLGQRNKEPFCDKLTGARCR